MQFEEPENTRVTVAESAPKRFHDVIWALAQRGCLPADSDEERLKKAMLSLISGIIALLAVGWGLIYTLSGFPESGSIPLTYASISFVSIWHFFYSKKFRFFRFSQLFLILILPFLLQFSLGGFAGGSAVTVWAFFAPLAALFFADIATAFRWLLAYLVATIIFGIVDFYMLGAGPIMSKSLNTTFFVMNMGGGFALIYVVIHYFVKDREEANQATLRVMRDVESSRRELEHAYRQLKDNEARIRELMLTDPLTGAANRRYLDERLEQELIRVRRYGNSLCVIMTDLDHFKMINDTFGHSVGDQVLIRFTTVIKENIRAVDFVARFGGEEFVLLLPETSLSGALHLAERIRQHIANSAIEGINQKVSASFGVAAARADETADRLLRRVDAALYKSKQQGRDCVTCDPM